jgi:hypothetical protein
LRDRLPAFAVRLALVLVMVAPVASAEAASRTIDTFESLEGWTTAASEGAQVWIVQEPGRTGMGMRIGFDLNSAGGYVLVRKAFSVALPANYAFSFQLRGEARPNNFEFKLVDPSGKNVWWRKQNDFAFPTEWGQFVVRKSRISFAWGPSGGRELRQVGAIEFAISGGQGGKGTIWIDDLVLQERPPPAPPSIPEVRASTTAAGHDPAFVVDEDAQTSWKSEPLPRDQWLLLDFTRSREYGGLVIDWNPTDYARSYEVRVSNDGQEWQRVYGTTTGHGARDYVYLPDGESRFVRLDMARSSRSLGYGIRGIAVRPVDFSDSPNAFFAAIANDAPPGTYPKYLYGQQTYWTVVGVDGDGKEALLNEEGMLEVDKGAFSIEPMLYVDGGLVTWKQVETAQKLADGYLPIPSVVWRHERLTLTVTAFAAGEPGASTLFARYRVENHGQGGQPVRLFLAMRPFQVNPPWQSLTMSGGVTRIQEIRFDGRVVWVNRDRAVVSLTTPDNFGATTFEGGSVTEALRQDKVPLQSQVTDPLGFASAALQYNLYVEPGKHDDIEIAVPFHEAPPAAAALLAGQDGRSLLAEQLEKTRGKWREALERVDIRLPGEAREIVQSLRTTLAYILINREGGQLRPGARNYARTWIRDGAMTSASLLALGYPEPVRDFLRWYARYQGPDGKVPCCVDRRGADPVSEHDSPGQFIYAIMEYYRYTRDVGLVHDLWPNVLKAVDYMVALRARRLGDAYRTPEKDRFYGLLPESISHEGYAAHPVHSYWDDFFALRGFKDAAEMAVVMGDDEQAARLATLRDEFRTTLYKSIARTMAKEGIDYIPGSADLGDFDPTSTSIALLPGGELKHLPAAALTRTFDRYWEDFERRRKGEQEWQQYTPYELRNVGTFVVLGQKERALALLDYFLADQRPRGWNEWAEIAWRDPAAAQFIGDMPHTWVGSGFIRSVRAMLAYEREADRSLVIAAGVPEAWIAADGGVAVKRLPTHYGVLSYTLRADGPDRVRVQLAGDLGMPAGGIVVTSPLTKPLRSASVGGRTVEPAAGAVTVREFPAEVILEY